MGEFEPGDYVKIRVAHQFKGEQLGIIESFCKDKHPLVYVTNKDYITKRACVDPERGDTIIMIQKGKANRK